MRFSAFFFLFVSLVCQACSDDNGQPDPDPVPPVKPGELSVIWSTPSDSVMVGKETEFTFKVSETDHPEAFTFVLDTTASGPVNITINNTNFKGVTSVNPDVENTVKFSNPQRAGDYKLKFAITDKNKKKVEKTFTIKAYAPEAKIELSNIPDSVAVETSAEFIFKINGPTGEEYSLSVDTVIPVFGYVVINNGGYDLPGGPRQGVDLTVNGKGLLNVGKIVAGNTNTVKFSNPQVVGDYKITLKLEDKYGNTLKKELTIKAYSPNPVIVKFYEVDPWLELNIYDKTKFYEELNKNYTYDPLSSVFTGKRVDTIYTKESPTNIPTPGSWTFPGRGITCHIGQVGGKDFFFPTINFNSQTYTLIPQWDGDYPAKMQKQGFHCMEFNTNPVTERPSVTTYTLYLYDHWGKQHTEKITVVALDRNQVKPATGNRIPD